MKINKACDLSSISVLPPHTRRSSGSCSIPDVSSAFRQSQPSSQQQQQRSQSFSQGISSQQNAIFSQFSQNSQDETLTNDQLMVSQEREHSAKRFSSLPPVNHAREEGQMPLSRSSTSLIRKWNSARPEQRCQMTEEFEYRIGTIETSLSRFGLMLESLQGDIMQVNKGTKELAMEIESIRQKLIVHDNSLQIINKGQEDMKVSLNGRLQLISDQFSQDKSHQSSQEISLLLSGLPEKIGEFIMNLRNDLSKVLTDKMQEMVCKLKAQEPKNPRPTVLPPKAVIYHGNPQGTATQNPAVPRKIKQANQIPKVEMGTWNSVKREQATLMNRVSNEGQKQKGLSPSEKGREWRIVIDSDEETDDGFSFLFEEMETGSYSMEKAKEETGCILRKARRRKRKHCNTIIIS